MDRLNQLALDIEFLLISVIQGVALNTLTVAALSPLNSWQLQTFPYIAAAFLFILIFWSGAILHALSFIDWPIDLYHTFLYFLASFVEIMAIFNVANPLLWFVFLLIFQIVALGLYLYDWQMIKKQKKKMSDSPIGKRLYNHVHSEQRKELFVFVPAFLIFNLIAVASIFFRPELFVTGGYHLVFIFLQILFAISFLFQEIKTFKERSWLLLQYHTKK